MPLTMAGVGQPCTIRKIGGSGEIRRFLENLGFLPGAQVTVLSVLGGSVIVTIKDARVALNADMARRIYL